MCMSSVVRLMCALLITSVQPSAFLPGRFRDKGATNSERNVKHQGEVIIKIYVATELQ